ncbi:head-tail connector protein [Ruminiclostridium papyrosolvens]|uniref:DNA packaging protein n=1 Tax=Ruminiclostridium papyrosolvens C7 TaxID=1330534 RepID=U4R224_9FIRM|nr:head-tail connector protein [Ruminiclostridium papyrosolvens]EPR12317.1 DNA packaging protein [Ruminiclostridium papyrosolvens C7]
MILTLVEAKKYLKGDESDTSEDLDILSLITAAEEYLKNAGCKLPEGNELAKLAIKLLVVHWHENREPIGKADKLQYSLSNIILQLQYCYEEETII